ncbi:Fibronectin type III domain protein [Archangium gephyra]|nr:Fibronectin type III domain protein [Archangium gephyra]
MTRNLLLLCTVLLAACGEAPTVSIFTVAPGTIAKGASAKLVFAAEGEDKLTLEPGVGDVTGKSEVEVTPGETTNYTLTASNRSGSTLKTLTVTVGPTPAAGFKLAAPDAFTAGTPANVTITVVEPSGATVPSYTGTVHLVSNDGAAELPADFTFTAADKGVKTVPVTFRTAGARQLIASGTVGGGMVGSFSTTSAPLTVKAGPAARMNLSGLVPESESGAEVSFQVSFVDAFGNLAQDYSTQLRIRHTDASAPAVPDVLVEASSGTATIRLSFFQAGVQTVTVQDTHNDAVTASAELRVRPSRVVSYALSGLPATARVGEPLTLSITALDAKGNRVTSYAGKASISSADAAMESLAEASFTQGLAMVPVAFRTPGSQTVTATEVGGTLTATTSSVTVTAAEVARLVLSGAGPATAGGVSSFTVTAMDTFGNTVTGYRGTVGFSTTDSRAGLPATYTFTDTDSGSRTFSASFQSAGTQSLTVTDSARATLTASGSFAVSPAAASACELSEVPATTTAGKPVSMRVTVRDAFANTVSGFGGTVLITSSDTNPAARLPDAGTYVPTSDQGSRLFTATLAGAGSQTLTATEASGAWTCSAPITIHPAAPRLVLSGAGPATAGGSVSFTATVTDTFGNTLTDYRGTVEFSSTDSRAELPASYMFTAADSGTHTFPATFKSAGTQSLTVTDSARADVMASGSFAVSPAAASACELSEVPATATAGAQIPMRVTVRDAFDNTVSGFNGTVAITSSDTNPAAAMPEAAAFMPAKDQGSRLFTAKLAGTGSQTLTATEASGAWTCSAPITIRPAGPRIVLSGSAPATAGDSASFTATVMDMFGNPLTDYRGTVGFSSTDSRAELPASYTFTDADSGSRTFSATFKTAGSQSVTVTDSASSEVTGSTAFSVSAAAASACAISDVPATAIAGAQVPVRVTVRDAFDNTVSGFNGTVAITSSDTNPAAAMPEAAAFMPAKDQGSRLFTAKLAGAGSQTLTATESAGAWTCSAPVTINPAAPRIHVTLPSDTNAGYPVDAVVSVKDTFGNPISYAGSLTFTSTDTAATLPGTLTLSGSESGSSVVTATFNTLGAQQLKASLVGDASLSGSGSTAVHGLVYTDPTPGMGKVRFVLNAAASSAKVVQLDLVSNTSLVVTGTTTARGGVYSAGMNLPLDTTRVEPDTTLLVEGNALNLGSAPKAVAAALPASGPTAGVLYTGVSQKFDGAGKVTGDTTLLPGRVFYSVRLKLPAKAPVGTVFNGPTLDTRFRAAVRNRAGDEVMSNADFALGKLEIR